VAGAQQAETFFEKVRVFTVVLNAEALSVRMHRATPQGLNGLQYYFTKVVHSSNYSKMQVCLLLRQILEQYAIKEPHPILNSAPDTVTEEYSIEVSGGRRAESAETTMVERVEKRGTPLLPQQNSQSFGLSALSRLINEGPGALQELRT